MQYGTARTDRTFFTEEQIRICQPQAVIEKNCWKICFFLPLETAGRLVVRFHKLPVQKLPVTFTKCVKAVMPNRFIMQVIRR